MATVSRFIAHFNYSWTGKARSTTPEMLIFRDFGELNQGRRHPLLLI